MNEDSANERIQMFTFERNMSITTQRANQKSRSRPPLLITKRDTVNAFLKIMFIYLKLPAYISTSYRTTEYLIQLI